MAKSISKMSISLTADISKFAKRFGKAGKLAKKFAGAAAAAGAKVAMFGAAAATAAGAGLAAMVAIQMRGIDATTKFADRIGISTEALMGLERAAGLTGVKSTALSVGLQRMGRRLAEVAATGGGVAKSALDGLGVSIEDLQRLSPDKQFEKIAIAFEGITNPAERTLLAFKLFDTEGVGLLNTMRLVADQGIGGVIAEADKLGLTLSRVDAAKVEQANDALAELKSIAVGVARQIAAFVAPMLTDVADRIKRWAIEGGGVKARLEPVFRWLVAAGGFMGDVMDALTFGWLLFKQAAMTAATAVVEALAWMGRQINVLIQMFPGMPEAAKKAAQETSDLLGAAAKGMGAGLDELQRELDEFLVGPSRSEQLTGWFDDVTKAATEAGEATAAAAESVQDTDAAISNLKAMQDEQRALESAASRVFTATRTPAERYATEIEELSKLLEANAIDLTTFFRAAEQAQTRLADASKKDAAGDSQFAQVNLSQIALNSTLPTARNTKPQEVTDPAVIEGNRLLRRIELAVLSGGGARAV